MAGFRLYIIIALVAVGGIIVKAVTKDSKFAFGPFLAIGIAIGSLWGPQIAQWYLNIPERLSGN